MFKDYSDEIMNEILGGANGPIPNKADKVVKFFDDLGDLIQACIDMVKGIFEKLTSVLG